METQPNLNPLPTTLGTPAEAAANKDRLRRKREIVLSALRRRREQSGLGWAAVERQIKTTALMSLARRAIRRVVHTEPQTFSQRLRRERLLRKWTGYSKDLASITRSGAA